MSRYRTSSVLRTRCHRRPARQRLRVSGRAARAGRRRARARRYGDRVALLGNQAYDRAKASMVPSERDKLYHSANNRGYAAQGFGLAAVACAGAAVYLYVRDRGADRGEPVGVLPVASSQFAGLAVAGSW